MDALAAIALLLGRELRGLRCTISRRCRAAMCAGSRPRCGGAVRQAKVLVLYAVVSWMTLWRRRPFAGDHEPTSLRSWVNRRRRTTSRIAISSMAGPERGLISIDSEWLVMRLDSLGRVSDFRLVTD